MQTVPAPSECEQWYPVRTALLHPEKILEIHPASDALLVWSSIHPASDALLVWSSMLTSSLSPSVCLLRMIAWLREQLSSPLRLIVLVCLSPFLLMSLPVLVFALPGAIVVYVAWSIFGPVGPPKKVLRSEAIGDSKRDAKEGPPHRNVLFKSELVEDKDGLHTIPDLMRATCERYGSHKALGSRRLIQTAEKDVELVIEGRKVTKKHKIPWLSDYEWITFTEFGQRITDLGHGLMEGTQHPMKFGDKVSLFAGTRPEWQITAQAAFEQGLVVVTVYPSLGPDALSFSLNQTKCSHLVTQASLIETVIKSSGQLNGALKCIIVMDEIAPGKLQQYQKECGMEILLWTDVMKRGGELAQKAASSRKAPARKPKPEDHAVIMFTSGSMACRDDRRIQSGMVERRVAGRHADGGRTGRR
jgi:hypothetical protein